MIHVGQRKFTEAEELVRVTGPFHIEIVSEIEPQVDLPALQLVNDGAVVNAMNGHARVKQTVSLPAVWAVIPEGRAWPRLLSVVCRVLSLRTARESPEFCVNASRIG